MSPFPPIFAPAWPRRGVGHQEWVALIRDLAARFSLLRKAASFAAIGLVNAAVDAGLFFLVLNMLASRERPALVVANLVAWFFAASGSYVMNSLITFAAESGRRLTLRSYAAFLASGVVGALANTATLLLVAIVLPVWAAKACAIAVSFAINFSMSHFVVFRKTHGRQ